LSNDNRDNILPVVPSFNTWAVIGRYTAFIYRGTYKSLARPGMKQATATEDFDFHISYL